MCHIPGVLHSSGQSKWAQSSSESLELYLSPQTFCEGNTIFQMCGQTFHISVAGARVHPPVHLPGVFRYCPDTLCDEMSVTMIPDIILPTPSSHLHSLSPEYCNDITPAIVTEPGLLRHRPWSSLDLLDYSCPPVLKHQHPNSVQVVESQRYLLSKQTPVGD